MKKSISILIALLLGIATLLSVFGCSFGTQNDLQSKVDELQSQLEEMENRLAEMDEQLRERNAAIEDLNGSLADLDERLRQRDAVIEDLNDQIQKRDERIEQLEKELNATQQDDNLEWTNENAVYAYVKAGFENEILKDVEGAFESLRFRKVYVTEKNANEWTPLRLLFVLDEDETEIQQDFIRLLMQDERINGARSCRDIEFETVDTRYIEKEKDTIAVGEEMRLTLEGYLDGYFQPFDFGGLYVKPLKNKNYSVEDFVGIDLKSVTMTDSGWLYLELAEENYFNVIKAADILSRLPEMEEVEPDWNRISIIPPIWEISDETVASLSDVYNLEYTIIKGLKPGEVTVELAGVSCKIKVN